MNFHIIKFESIGSTNTEAMNQAKHGADEGLCIVAREQSAGRGRYGRVWVSEKDAGLYFSLVLRPQLAPRFLPLITLAAAVAVHDALESAFGLNCDIKWVNDLHVGDKKISGILAETTETDSGLAVIVGIGINLKASNFPPEVADTATSVETETGNVPSLDQFLPSLTSSLGISCDLLYGADGPQKTCEAWTARSSYASGKEVRVVSLGEEIRGITDGIEENGALRLRTSDGSIKIINAGEVEQLRKL